MAGVSYVRSRAGVIHLSAALWGGDFRRTVPLSLGQAHALGAELLGLVQLAIREDRRGASEVVGASEGVRADRLQPGAGAAAFYREVAVGYPRPRVRPARALDSAG